MDYIGPEFQLPERALSRCVSDMQALVLCVSESFNLVWRVAQSFANAIIESFKPVIRLIKCALNGFYDADLLKRPRRKHHKRAYHPHSISHKRALIAQRKMGIA